VESAKRVSTLTARSQKVNMLGHHDYILMRIVKRRRMSSKH